MPLNPHELEQEFPELLGTCEISVGPGWFYLIQELCKDLEEMIADGMICNLWDDESAPRATQVKEKFGTLRFYMSTETDAMSKRIREAEAQSSQTCENCGMMGKMREKDRWYRVRCDLCWEKKDE